MHYEGIGCLLYEEYWMLLGCNVLSCAVLVLLALPAEGDAKGVPCCCHGHEVGVL